MKYAHIVLIITLPCIAMEKEAIEHPRAIAFVDNNTVAVGGENGCAIFKSHSQQLIKKLTQNNIISLVANKDIIAIIRRKKLHTKLTVFDAVTHKKKWGKDTYHSQLTLNSAHETIVSCATYDTDIYHYKTQATKNTCLSFFANTAPYNTTTCHPTQNSLIYSIGTSLWITHPLKKQYNKDTKLHEFCPLQNIGIHHNIHAVEGTACSPDGNKILFKYNKGWRNYASYFIYDLTDTKEVAHYVLDSQKYNAFAFHPTISLLAALSQDNKVKFWDYTAHKLIATTDQLSNTINPGESFRQQLSFSPDGSQLAVALPESWHILSTPHIQNKNYALILETLRANCLPEDIVQLIIPDMIGCSSLSYVDIAGLMNVAPVIIPPISEPDLSQETQRKSIQHWVEFKDPNGEDSEESEL
jgi:WD40 repeat protein